MRARPATAVQRRTNTQLAYHRNRRRRWQRVRRDAELDASRIARERKLSVH